MFDWVKKLFPVGGPEFNSPSWLWASGRSAAPGGMPSPEQLASLSAVYRACCLYSDASASQRWNLRQESPAGGSVTLRGTDAATAVAGWSYSGREFWLYSALLSGNGYARLVRNQRGGVGEIISIAPWRVCLEFTESNTLYYRIAEDQNLQEPEMVIPAQDMLHLRYRSTGKHDLLGVAPLATLAPALAPYFEIRESLREIFTFISQPGSYFQSDMPLQKEQVEQIREGIESRESGRPVILGNGLKMEQAPVPALRNLQALELSKFGVDEVARAYSLSSSLLAQTENVNYSSASEQSRQFTVISLQPFARRVESALDEALLTRQERMAGVGFAIDLQPMLTGNGSEKSEFYSRLVNGGIMTVNESRSANGLGSLPGGDILRAPVNTQPLDQWSTPEPEPEEIGKGCANVIKMLDYA